MSNTPESNHKPRNQYPSLCRLRRTSRRGGDRLTMAWNSPPASATHIQFGKIKYRHVWPREPGFPAEVQEGVALKVVAVPASLRVLAPFICTCEEPFDGFPISAGISILPETNEPAWRRVVGVQAIDQEGRRLERPSGTDHDIHGRSVSQPRESLSDRASPTRQPSNGDRFKAGRRQVILEYSKGLRVKMVASHGPHPKRRASFGRRTAPEVVAAVAALPAAPPLAP